jgi:hypothetical protein
MLQVQAVAEFESLSVATTVGTLFELWGWPVRGGATMRVGLPRIVSRTIDEPSLWQFMLARRGATHWNVTSNLFIESPT